MTIKNNRVYIAAGMFCGTDDSDLLVPEVYENREDARKAIIEAILGAAASAELMDEERNLRKDEFGDERVVVTVQGMVNGENVLDDSLTALTDEEIDRVVPADVSRITIKDYSYDDWNSNRRVCFYASFL